MILISSIIISIPLWLIAYTLKEISIIKMRIDDINDKAAEMIKQNKQIISNKEIKNAAKYYTRMQYPMGVEEEYPINDFIAGVQWHKEQLKKVTN